MAFDDEEEPKPEIYRVRNWREFQHYKDRNPPWIKLHFSLLSSADWVMLDDASRVLAIASMLIASRNEGKIPTNAAYIKRVAYLKSVNFKPLIECGFLECASGRKQMLANARPEESRGETYKEETETPCAVAQESRPPKKSNGKIEFDGVNFQGITEAQELRWQEAYPAVPIPPAIAQAAAWLKANPANRKTNCERFLVNWFKRDQDHAGRVKR